MSAVTYWRRKGSRTVHIFRPMLHLPGFQISLCERHQFSPPPLALYAPWKGEGEPPTEVLCKACAREDAR